VITKENFDNYSVKPCNFKWNDSRMMGCRSLFYWDVRCGRAIAQVLTCQVAFWGH